MAFDEWKRLVKKAGAAFDFVDPQWVEDQFKSGRSPVEVAQLIKGGNAPRFTPADLRPASEQPFVIKATDPKAMRIPRDKGEWQIFAVVTSIILYGSLFVFLRAHSAREAAYSYDFRRVEMAEISARMTQYQYTALIAFVFALVALRSLFFYSPYVAWNLKRTYITGGLILLVLLLPSRL